MLSRPIFLSVLLGLFATSHCRQFELSADELGATHKAITTLIQNEIDKQKIPGLSAAVAVDNEIVYSRGFGHAVLEHSVPATPETRYRTASIAKPITAVLAMKLVEQGKLDLDKDIREYLPDFPEKKWSITARQLLSHQAGIRHYTFPFEASGTNHYSSVNSALRIFKKDDLLHEPGTKYRYSTYGFNLLGAVLEKVGEDDFMTLLEQHLLKPAGMSNTCEDSHFAIIPNRTRGYMKVGRSRARHIWTNREVPEDSIIHAEFHDTSMKIPGGGLLSTAEDLASLAIAIHQGKVLSDETVQTMWTRQSTQDGEETTYGLGWRVGLLDGHRYAGHGGAQAGTATFLLTYPDSGTTIALMCNLRGTQLQHLAREIGKVVNPPQGNVGKYSEAVEKLDAAIRFEVQQKQLPAFSISIVDNDQIAWSAGYGFQDADQKVKATADTVYRVGSISKLFTDITVMQLVEEGKLDLDTPVSEYLPDFQPNNPYGIPITLRQLMSHRSGLVRESPVGNYFDPTEPSLSATVESLNDTTLVYKPETKTKYSNAAIAVVGSILEEVADGTHPEEVGNRILDPLGMSNSDFELTPEVDQKLATALMRTYDGRRFEAPKFLLGTGPAGNMYSSTNDLSKFLICLFADGKYDGKQIIRSETLKKMTTPMLDQDGKPQGFGIGFHIQDLDGFKKIGHGGAVYGFSTQLEALPERKLGVAAVCSLDGTNAVVRRLSDFALRLMIASQNGDELPTYETTSPVPPTRAKELVGRYKEVDGERFTQINELDGEVMMQRGTFRYDLRAKASDGSIVVDDVLGYGTAVELKDNDRLVVDGATYKRLPDEPPATAPDRWKGLIGEYGWDHNTLYILEEDGKLHALIEWFYEYPLTEINENEFAFPDYGLYHGEGLKFTRDENGVATEVVAAEVTFQRREIGTKDGETFKITPVKPIDELRAGALAATPPPEPGDYRDPNLIQLNEIDPTIRLDVRYATTNNFTGAVFYKQPRAFMQRPAAQAVARANQRLKQRGLGILVHDAYRPWFVTKMFWDATPVDLKDFVANPANGSRHNRGCAVDLTLYDLSSGEPIQMVAGYDEFSQRSFPLYPGGTSRQRWYRDMLRRTMEAEGFTIYEYEWWHFDFKDWKQYRIGNQTFEEILDEAK